MPALAALGVKQAAETSDGGDGTIGRFLRGGFSHPRLTSAYRRTLDFVFRRPWWGVAIGLTLPIAGFVQSRLLPEQFFPPADRDQFQIELKLPPQASLDETLQVASEVRQRLLHHDRVERVHWFLGESSPTFYYNVVPRRKNTPRYAQALVQLDSAEGAREVIRDLQRELDAAFPSSQLLVRQLEQGPPFDAPVEVRLYGPDVQRLRELGDEVRAVMAGTPDVIHTSSELSEALPSLELDVDEEAVRLAGLSRGEMARQLEATLEGAVGGSVLEDTEELPVRVRVANRQRDQLSEIASLDMLAKGGRRVGAGRLEAGFRGVPLTAVAEVNLGSELAGIAHFNGRRMNEIQAYTTAGVLPAEVLARLEERLAASGFQPPPGYSFEYGGEAAKRDDAVGNLMANVGVLLVLMVATLVLSFRSFRIAGLVGSVAALSVGLGLGSLWLWGYPFGFMAIIGTMGLVGVAINDAIVVLAGLREDKQARAGDPAAVREVVVRSTRHVVATSLTTMAGFAPLILGGGGFWPPLAVAIAGGVGGATILALYFIPAAYILVMCRGNRVEVNDARIESLAAAA